MPDGRRLLGHCHHHRARQPVVEATTAIVGQDRQEAGEQRDDGEDQCTEPRQRPHRVRRLAAVGHTYSDPHDPVSRRLTSRGPEDHEAADRPEHVCRPAPAPAPRDRLSWGMQHRKGECHPGGHHDRHEVDDRGIEGERDRASHQPLVGRVHEPGRLGCCRRRGEGGRHGGANGVTHGDAGGGTGSPPPQGSPGLGLDPRVGVTRAGPNAAGDLVAKLMLCWEIASMTAGLWAISSTSSHSSSLSSRRSTAASRSLLSIRRATRRSVARAARAELTDSLELGSLENPVRGVLHHAVGEHLLHHRVDGAVGEHPVRDGVEA